MPLAAVWWQKRALLFPMEPRSARVIHGMAGRGDGMIDTHVHVVVGNPGYPKNLSVEGLIAALDGAGVAHAIVVQSRSGNGLDSPAAAQAAAKYPDRLIAVCGGDPTADNAAATLRLRVSEWGARGVRVFWGPSRLSRRQDHWFWAEAEALAIPVLIAGHARFPEVGELLDTFPALQVVLDHCGDPHLTRGLPKDLLRLAERRGVFMKVTSHLHVQAELQGASPKAVIDGMVAAFGPNRIMWGSNYPASHEPRWTYPGTVTAFLELISAYPTAQRQEMIAGTAITLWPELAAAPTAP